jgi:IrrE N-terminal-like domain
MSDTVDPVSVYVQGFLATFGSDCGKRLHEIATTIGITVTEVDAESFEGALIRIVGAPKGKIALNRNIREPGRKRFTLAHELGHYILPMHAQQSVACRSSSIERWTPSMPPAELEANRFAAAILMPQPALLTHLRKEPSLAQARSIATQCDASLTAATYRLVDLSSYPIALVWSTSGRRTWYHRSAEFGRAVELGPVAPESFARDCFQGRPVPARPEPVPAGAWLYEDGLVEGARIWEESTHLPFYDAVLTLLCRREPVDDRDNPGIALDDLDPKEFTLRRQRWPTK